jgi:hypothetical protein
MMNQVIVKLRQTLKRIRHWFHVHHLPHHYNLKVTLKVRTIIHYRHHNLNLIAQKTSIILLPRNDQIQNKALPVTNNYNKPSYLSNKKLQIIGEERIRVAEDIVNNFDGSAKFYVSQALLNY